MYFICGIAFYFYVTKFPERLYPGLVDMIGHSHQWWHTLIFLALLFWHNTGVTFAMFRLKHGCTDTQLTKSKEMSLLCGHSIDIFHHVLSYCRSAIFVDISY